jgi:hypothetical protein
MCVSACMCVYCYISTVQEYNFERKSMCFRLHREKFQEYSKHGICEPVTTELLKPVKLHSERKQTTIFHIIFVLYKHSGAKVIIDMKSSK